MSCPVPFANINAIHYILSSHIPGIFTPSLYIDVAVSVFGVWTCFSNYVYGFLLLPVYVPLSCIEDNFSTVPVLVCRHHVHIL